MCSSYWCSGDIATGGVGTLCVQATGGVGTLCVQATGGVETLCMCVPAPRVVGTC